MADRVTRAIVDAASTDSGALSGRLTTTRYLMPIANLPVICHVLAELSSGGIEEARILTFNGVRAELETLLGTGEAWNLRLSYDEVE
jgi:dTDP-glucose pyrophosphorylase